MLRARRLQWSFADSVFHPVRRFFHAGGGVDAGQHLPAPAGGSAGHRAAVGAAAESSMVFVLLVFGVGNRVTFIVLGAVCLAVFWRLGRDAARLADPAKARADRVTLYLTGPLAGAS